MYVGYLNELTNEDNWMVTSSSFTAADDDLVVVGGPTYIPTSRPTIDESGTGDNDDNVDNNVVDVYGTQISVEVSVMNICTVFFHAQIM